MNKLERFIYNSLKSSPAVKNVVRNLYQMTFDLLPTPANRSVAPIELREGFFYGFHDRSPFSPDMSRLLANHSELPIRMPNQGEALEVGYFDFKEGKMGDFHPLAQTTAWNWHKGCRLQWVDNDCIAFNVEVDNELKCCILDCRTNEKSYLPFPVDTVSEDGRLATNFSYERLSVLMPGYGYPYCHDGGYLEQKAPAETGLFLIDMASGKRRMLLSLEQLAGESDSPLAALESHFVTHSEFSKDGRYVSFMHRHIGQDYRKRTSRLIVYDLQTNEHFALPTTGMVSHYCWNNRNQIVCYCSVAEGDAHVLFDIPSGKYRPVLLNKLNEDGHQSMVNDSIFVTDTYPDARRMATLWAVDMEHDVRTELAYLHSPKQFQTQDEHRHIACDLHPRVSPDGHYVCFDSVHTGKRALCVMPLVLNK